MLTPAEALYLKTYDKKHDDLTIEEIEARTESQLDIVLNMRDGGDAKLNEITLLVELVYYAALKQVQQDGHRDNVCFMASGVANEYGRLCPLPAAAIEYIQRNCQSYFFATFGNMDYMVFTDVDTSEDLGKRMRTLFNTTDTAPRLARRAYVEEHAKR